jgi:hypothetical protein
MEGLKVEKKKKKKKYRRHALQGTLLTRQLFLLKGNVKLQQAAALGSENPQQLFSSTKF